MEIHSLLKLGDKYSKKELSSTLDERTLSLVREGLYHCKNSNTTLFFVDLEKKGKEDRFHFDDFFEGEYFHWDSQTTQHINSPKIQEIVTGFRVPHLFVRIQPKIKGKTQPFVYCGRLIYSEYEKGTSKPVHIIFQNEDYDDFTENEDLMEIYLWKPEKVGKTSKSKITKKSVVSEKRKIKYKKPNQTERKGLVTSRVGQGYYRQQIIEKWNGQCPVTECDITEILISSHIVPWSESNDDEKLDPNNGILLSPNIDSLFDKHLISFEDSGNIIISNKINSDNKLKLSIQEDMSIIVNEEMKKYLKKHRKRFYEKN
jgi:Domain of unknown function (DUF3427)/HNH endonuclease